jgi:HNH endonuclease
MFSVPAGEQLLATILKHDSKTTSYKFALLRALNDVVLGYPDLALTGELPVAVPLARLAEWWLAYYWPFADPAQPVLQGRPAQRGDAQRQDMSFRPALVQLRSAWQQLVVGPSRAGDGYFLLTEMRSPRRRGQYPAELLSTYDQARKAAVAALAMPIRHAGTNEQNVFAAPVRLRDAVATALPGTDPAERCLLVPAYLWRASHRLSLYVEALCVHEWSLFTEQLGAAPRGAVYALLTARPDNRQALTWERNHVNVLLMEQHSFVCPWTGKLITRPDEYDLDHLLPLSFYPVNELWNLLPVDRRFNQHTKRNRLPSAASLAAALPGLAASYGTYGHSNALGLALHQDAALRFGTLVGSDFPAQLAARAVAFIDDVATARLAGQRF